MKNENTLAIIMAAGEGKRMHSDLPKVLHEVCGKPLAQHVLDALEGVCEKKVLIVKYRKEQVMEALRGQAEFVEQLDGGWGTGQAVKSALPYMQGDGLVIIAAGDMPLVRRETFEALADKVRQGYAGALLYDEVDKPFGYGRVILDAEGCAMAIVEQKDLKPDQLDIRAINASVYCFDMRALAEALPRLDNHNAANEYYLTDVVGILSGEGRRIAGVRVPDKAECMGINTPEQLAEAEAEMKKRI